MPEDRVLLHRLTYESRYGYPFRVAAVAELWWRLEHCGIAPVERYAYPRRKAAERRGSA